MCSFAAHKTHHNHLFMFKELSERTIEIWRNNIKKDYSPAGKSCKVPFSLPTEVEFESVVVLGDLNDWEPENGVLKRKKDRTFSHIALKAGNAYRFRYLVNGDQWTNDTEADSTEPIEFDTHDSVVKCLK